MFLVPFLFIFSLALATPRVDGISFRVRQEIIDKLLVALTPRIIHFTKNLKLDDFHQDIPLGSADYSNIKVLDFAFVQPVKVRLDQAQLCIESEELTSRVSIQIFLKLPLITANFVVEANLKLTHFFICQEMELDQQHKFVVQVARSNVVVDEIELTLKNVLGDKFNKLSAMLGWLSGTIKGQINNFLATGLPKNIDEAMAKNIDKHKPVVPVDADKGVFLDLTPTHAPLLNDGITYSTKGYVFQEKERVQDFEHEKAPKELPRFEEGYGFTIYVNDFVLRSVAGMLWQYSDLFTRTFTERSSMIDFDFTVEGFSKIFQTLDKKYPKELKTKLVVRVSQPPNVQIRNDYISIFLWVDVDVIVIQDEKDVKFGVFSVIANVDAVPSLEDIKVLKVVPRASTIVDFDEFLLYGVEVDRELINQTVNGAVQLWINYFGFEHKTELDVILNQVTFEKTMMKLQDNLLVLAASVSFKDFPAESPKKSDSPVKDNEGLQRANSDPGKKGQLIPENFQRRNTAPPEKLVELDTKIVATGMGKRLAELGQKAREKAQLKGQGPDQEVQENDFRAI